MAEKNPGMTPEEQSKKFEDAVREMIDAGELNPTEADDAFDRLMNGIRRPFKAPSADCGD